MFRFNVRVYGLYYSEQKILLSREHVKGSEIIKFPGGGLEYGEGLKEALKREWLEELNCPIRVGNHFYTTDYFQKSAWDESQVISIYYIVKPESSLRFPFDNGNEIFDLYSIDEHLMDILTLPIDKIVGKMILKG